MDPNTPSTSLPEICPVCAAPRISECRPRLFDDRYGSTGWFEQWRCESCHHHWIVSDADASSLRELYTRYYPRAALPLEPNAPPPQRSRLGAWLAGEMAAAFRWVPPGVSVLDIGCGAGDSLLWHAARGGRAQGVELDENVARLAAARGLDVRIGAFRAKDYPGESFDFVTLDQVLEHAPEPVSLLEEVRAVLRPGGAVVLTTPNVESLLKRALGRRWIHWHAPYHLHAFSRASLEIAARRAGLSLRSWETLTTSRWLVFQLQHLVSMPRPGEPSEFWDRARSRRTWRGVLGRLAGAWRVTGVPQLVTRLLDAASLGDNQLAVLTRAHSALGRVRARDGAAEASRHHA